MCCSSPGGLEEPAALTPQSQRKAYGLEEPFERLLNLNLAASVPVLNESKEPTALTKLMLQKREFKS